VWRLKGWQWQQKTSGVVLGWWPIPTGEQRQPTNIHLFKFGCSDICAISIWCFPLVFAFVLLSFFSVGFGDWSIVQNC
jgi:hypothetical protein